MEVHERFMSHLDVLREVWRAQLRTLMDVDASGDAGAAQLLIDSIFPSLDTIYELSGKVCGTLRACNAGTHFLSPAPRAKQGGPPIYQYSTAPATSRAHLGAQKPFHAVRRHIGGHDVC